MKRKGIRTFFNKAAEGGIIAAGFGGMIGCVVAGVALNNAAGAAIAICGGVSSIVFALEGRARFHERLMKKQG